MRMLKNWTEPARTIVFVLMAIIGTFCIIQLTWYWGIKLRYEDAVWDLFADFAWERNPGEENGSYEIVEEGYRYCVYDTNYLDSSGFACISAETEKLDASGRPAQGAGDVNIMLNIGFKVFYQYSFQLDIENAEGRYQIEVDNHGNLITEEYTDPQYKKKMNKILAENRAAIDRLFYSADEKWNIQ